MKRLAPRKSSRRREHAHQRVVGRLDARCRRARRRAGAAASRRRRATSNRAARRRSACRRGDARSSRAAPRRAGAQPVARLARRASGAAGRGCGAGRSPPAVTVRPRYGTSPGTGDDAHRRACRTSASDLAVDASSARHVRRPVLWRRATDLVRRQAEVRRTSSAFSPPSFQFSGSRVEEAPRCHPRSPASAPARRRAAASPALAAATTVAPRSRMCVRRSASAAFPAAAP